MEGLGFRVVVPDLPHCGDLVFGEPRGSPCPPRHDPVEEREVEPLLVDVPPPQGDGVR